MADIDDNKKDSTTKKLYRLSELKDYSIAENETDIRGMEVHDREGNKLGTVSEMLVDTGIMKVKYLDVELYTERGINTHLESGSMAPEITPKDPASGDIYKEVENIMPGGYENPRIPDMEEPNLPPGEPYEMDTSRHILVPISLARLDNEHHYVIVSELERAKLVNIPTYDTKSDITPDYENALRRTIGMDTMTTADPDKFYEKNNYGQPDKYYGTNVPRRERKDDDISWDTSPHSRETE